ncbi:unnamed protein product [Rotaria sordida]|uniref:Uncharacterized protein n=1 Tax=Rotaria sordida TaxID=392033 RepID=A0A814I1M3_9BILA|nr:unnamed protein product [Rotaria sordida]
MSNRYAPFDILNNQQLNNLLELCQNSLSLPHLGLIQEVSAALVPYTSGKFELMSDMFNKQFNIKIDANKLQLISSLFGSNILPSFSTGFNAKDLILEFSLLNKLPSFTPYQFIPFIDICPTCSKKLDRNLSKEHLVTLYLHNHHIVPAVVFTLTCTHSRTNKNNHDKTIITPNFIQHNNERVFTCESFRTSNFLYFGGKSVFDRNILIQYMSDLITNSSTLEGFVSSYNIQRRQKNIGDSKLGFLLFTRTVLSFALIHFVFFMGLSEIALPKLCRQEEMDPYFESIESHVHHLWSNFWLQHKSVKPCGIHCSRALIVDGNYKIRRPICVYNLNVIQTPEFESISVGCRNSPQYQDVYCEEHKGMTDDTEINLAEPLTPNESWYEKPTQLRNGKMVFYDALSCKTLKSKPGNYTSNTFRTLGIVLWILNCNIIVSSIELLRSESIKEIISGLCQLIRFSQTGVDQDDAAICHVPRNIVYDDGCHLIKTIIDHFDGILRRNAATTFLYKKCTFTIDRLHYQNHRDPWCKKYLNPDSNPDLDGINTEACEQTFSWLNKFSKSFSRMCSERCQLALHLMLHHWNCNHIGLNPYDKDIGLPLLPVNYLISTMPKRVRTQTCTVKQHSTKILRSNSKKNTQPEQETNIITSCTLRDQNKKQASTEKRTSLMVHNKFLEFERTTMIDEPNQMAVQGENKENMNDGEIEQQAMVKMQNHEDKHNAKDEDDELQEYAEEFDEEESNISNLIFPSQTDIEVMNFEFEKPCHQSVTTSNNFTDNSIPINDERALNNNYFQQLSSEELLLWEHFDNIISIDEFEKALPDENDQANTHIDRRSTRSFKGVIFH